MSSGIQSTQNPGSKAFRLHSRTAQINQNNSTASGLLTLTNGWQLGRASGNPLFDCMSLSRSHDHTSPLQITGYDHAIRSYALHIADFWLRLIVFSQLGHGYLSLASERPRSHWSKTVQNFAYWCNINTFCFSFRFHTRVDYTILKLTWKTVTVNWAITCNLFEETS